MKVVPFPDPSQTAEPDTIKLLEDFLELARKGEITHVAIAALHADRSTSTAYVSGIIAPLTGAVSYLLYRLHRKMEEP